MRGKGWILVLLLCAALFLIVSAASAQGIYRALLVSCDQFVTHPDTTPSARNNAEKIASALAEWEGYARVRTVSDRTGSIEALSTLIGEMFQDADDQDINVFYISTHGVYGERGAALVISDGQSEALVDAETLRALFDGIRGRKVLILDACVSGGMIFKGVDELAVRHAFTGDEYIVLTSSGGNEDSWYWQSDDSGRIGGGGFFADALAIALGLYGVPTADVNADGTVTVSELYECLLLGCALSTPQVYPLGCELAITRWQPGTAQRAAVADIIYETKPLSAALRDVQFSFTIMRQTHLMYRIVYFRDGAWRFSESQWISDDTEGYDEPLLSPGRKARTLTLRERDLTANGHVMVQMVAVENGGYTAYDAHLLMVEPLVGDPSLSVMAANVFSPSAREELPVIVRCALPCRLSVTVRDDTGGLVRRLAYSQNTRPGLYEPDGAFFCWDGRDRQGQIVPAGAYTLQVTSTVGDTLFEADPLTVTVR